MNIRNLAVLATFGIIFGAACAVADTTEAAAPAAAEAAPAAAPAAPPAPTGPTPLEKIAATKVGELKNPYANANDEVIQQGRKKYLSASCNGCHGGSGGGGMCPPLSNDVWVYGSDDDTLFRLISLGSIEFTKQTGVSRKGRENVVGPMPAHGTIVKTEDDLWKIITFIRANYRGDPSKKTW